MDCKQFEKLIPEFIDDKLDYPTLKEFYAHMENCEACMEELSISFLVADGLQRLESGDAFDLQKELDIRLELAKKKLHYNDGWLKMGFWLEIIAAGAFLGAVMWLLL